MEEEISIEDIFSILKKRIGMILSLSMFGLLLSALFTFFVVTPTYNSTTQLLVNRSVDSNVGLQLNDINTNVRMIDTYKDIIKGPVILEDVKENMDSDLSVAQLREMIAITANENSQVFSLTITSDNPVEAATIANAIASTFQNNISDIMKVDNVSIISEATINSDPVSPNIPMNLILGLLLGTMLGIGMTFLQHILDKTIKDSDYISENIGWPNLGAISVLSEEDHEEIDKYYGEKQPRSGRVRVV